MITSKQIAHRLTRSLLITEFASLPAGEQTRIQDAINAGWNFFIATLPSHRREESREELLAAPQNINITATDGAKAITYAGGWPQGVYTNEAALFGHAVQVAGDTRLNQLNSAGKLLGPYLGSGGPVAATFYGDTLQFSTDDLRIVNPPRFLPEDTNQQLPLRKLTPEAQPPFWHLFPFLTTIEVGIPQYWWTEPLRPTAAVSEVPTWLLRVWPLPQARGTLSFSLQTLPAAVGFDDVLGNRQLPVADRELPWLLNLCEQHLITSPLWNPQVSRNDVLNAASAAAQEMILLRNVSHDSEPPTVGTAAGY